MRSEAIRQCGIHFWQGRENYRDSRSRVQGNHGRLLRRNHRKVHRCLFHVLDRDCSQARDHRLSDRHDAQAYAKEQQAIPGHALNAARSVWDKNAMPPLGHCYGTLSGNVLACRLMDTPHLRWTV